MALVPATARHIHHVDGGYWRIHPGAKPKDDAIPRYFSPPGGPPVAASDRWRHLLSYAHACTVPQTDRLSKKIAWAELESLPDGYLDAGTEVTVELSLRGPGGLQTQALSSHDPA